jgi:predicted type IV restriction endonuclease
MSSDDLNEFKISAIDRIKHLVEDFKAVLAKGNKDNYNEERVKIAFVVPFLEALGWNPRTDSVLPEQATLTGRADFGLRVNGRTKVFVEMKSFSKNLDGHDTVKGRPRLYSEQAIQYAWGMKADWAVLTNFEETRIYDSHVKKSAEGLVWKKPLKFTEYVSRFDELWLLSKHSVSSGMLDSFKAKTR